MLPVEKFIYQKTEISEIAPRPSIFTLDLLKKIYADGGPVSKVYKDYNISYFPAGFIKIVGNELYSDLEAEIKTILPSYGYLPDGKVGFKKYSKIFPTIKNIFYLQKLSLKKKRILFEQIKTLLNSTIKEDASCIDVFLKNYSLIFEINLLAAKAIYKQSRTDWSAA